MGFSQYPDDIVTSIYQGDEIQLTDAMKNMSAEHKFYAKKFTGKRFDCGSPTGYVEANISYAIDENEMEMKEILRKYYE